jgi:hypothetical protein
VPNAHLPISQTPLTDGTNIASRPYYTFLSDLSTNVAALSVVVGDIQTKVAGSGSTLSPNANVTGGFSITTRGTLKTGIVSVLLDGDVDQAQALSFYGALDAGKKGWWNYSANFQKSTLLGAQSLDLSDLSNTNTGTFKLITRDGKGRLSGTLNGAAKDVPYDHAKSGLVAINVQSAIDEIAISGRWSTNYAVNGAFDVWQRGAYFVATAITPIADCWITYLIGSTMTVTRKSSMGEGLPDAARYFCRCVVTAGATAATIAQLILRVEDVHQFSGKTMSFALMARASINTTVGANLVQMYGNNAGSKMYGVGPLGRVAVTLVANTWTLIESGPIVMPALTLSADPDPGSDGLQISLWMNG